MPKSQLDTVRKLLTAYANRGLFRQFNETKGRGAKTEFTFEWIMGWPFTLVYDEKTETLQFKNLLPNVPPRSAMDRSLREFLAGRYDKKLPAHRRIDANRAEIKFVNRSNQLSLTMKVHRNQYKYAVDKLFKITNELFAHLNMYHLPYLWDEFDVPQE